MNRKLDFVPAADEAERGEDPDQMEPNDWQDVASDPETAAMRRLLPSANGTRGGGVVMRSRKP
ncbi:MAG: hypothetical protein H0T55_09135 [Rubrobacteraceae bacterium]|nr:hypothetical protein [Rubrobacteraceae bacterium]